MNTYSITIKGKSGKIYSFNFEGHEDDVQTWRDGWFEIDLIIETHKADEDFIEKVKRRS